MVTSLHILYGLPGSGKTTWVKKHKHNTAHVIDCDKMRGGSTPSKIAGAVRRQPRDGKPIIVDGLCTTPEQLKAIVEAADERNPGLLIWVEFWEKNVENCLLNDATRPPDRRAASTIRELAKTYRKPTMKFLEQLGLAMNEHRVDHSSYMQWWDKGYIKNPWTHSEDKHKLYSKSWILGGTESNYHGDEWEVSGEAPPVSFEDFDKLLERIAPHVTFMQYKRLERETVSIDEFTDNDYYHSFKRACFVCDLIRLEELLKEMGHMK